VHTLMLLSLACRSDKVGDTATTTDTGGLVDTATPSADTSPPVDTDPVDDDADDDGYSADVDCDDTDPAVHPGATEVCNELDDDCDGGVDNAVGDVFYGDTDGDGFGDPAFSTTSCEDASGFVADASDCDDANSDIHPDADEVCNGLDDDCDGATDDEDGDRVGGDTFYVDADGDGYGLEGYTTEACEQPDGYADNADDCNDASAAAYPDANEACNLVDDDCDGDVDENASDADTWYADADGDGYGDPDTSTTGCEGATGYVDDATDCDDTDASVNPGLIWYADADGDGFGDPDTDTSGCTQPSGSVDDDSDCDDTSDSVNPDADETCNELDDDCDGLVDDDDPDAATATWYLDYDDDGHGGTATTEACEAPEGYLATSTDCDDLSDGTWPGADELCDDEDNDCDGTVDEDATDEGTWYSDSDGDGYGDASAPTSGCDQPSGTTTDASDCDDTDADVRPGAAEVCDELDNDCDGATDDDDDGLAVGDTFYIDYDGDGYGSSGYTAEACEAPSGYVSSASDCDDADDAVHPGADERCNDADDDCDGANDEDPVDATTWSIDYDGDGYGNGSWTLSACDQPTGYVDDSADCDDTDAAVSPVATESCNDGDDDCDGTVDEDASDATTWYADADDDGYGTVDDTVASCDAPSGYVGPNTDCDDSDDTISPDGVEACDGVDNDCDGDADDGVLGAAEDCAAESCQAIVAAGDDDGDGEYWLDEQGVATLYTCDMSTDGGGWTRVVHWNAPDDGHVLADFEADFTENANSMGEWTDGSGYIQWSDYVSPYGEVLEYEREVLIANGGEVRHDIDYYGYSMEDSGVWFYVETTAGDLGNLLCYDIYADETCYSTYGYYTDAEWAWRPYDDCEDEADGTISSSLPGQEAFSDEVNRFALTSLHCDGSHGDYSQLAYVTVWVR